MNQLACALPCLRPNTAFNAARDDSFLFTDKFLVNSARPITAELALLFGRALGQSPQYWLNLQAAYDLKIALQSIGPRLGEVAELVAV